MGPVTWDSLLLEGSSEGGAHIVHTLAHGDELIEPLLSSCWVVEDGGSDSSSVLWWGRVVASDDDLDLAHDAASRGLVSAHDVESSGSLTIESHDFGEGLSDDHLEALIEEKSKSIGIGVKASRGEALVSGIKEWEKVVPLADSGDLGPLLLGWVNTGWVVSAGVEEDGRSWGGSLKVGNHAIDIKTLGLLVEVSVVSEWNSSSLKDLLVVTPGWVAHVEGSWSVLGKELSNHSEGTSSRQSLQGDDSWVANEWAVEAEEDATGTLVEISISIDWEVLLVELVVGHDLGLNLAHNWENIWLSIVVAVGTNTKVDLVWVLVGLEANSESEDWINWGLWHVSELVVQQSESRDHCI